MLSVKNKKLLCVVSGVLGVIMLGIIITVCVLFIPLNGSAYEYVRSEEHTSELQSQ